MLACNLASLAAVAQQLRAAAAQQDWLRVAQLDQVLALWLREPQNMANVASQREWRAAWQQVREAHAQAWLACQQAKAEAGAQLQQLQQSQEAQQAYAWQEVLK